MNQPAWYPARNVVHVVLIVVAVVLLLIYGLAGAGWVTTSHAAAFLGFGLASFAAAFI